MVEQMIGHVSTGASPSFNPESGQDGGESETVQFYHLMPGGMAANQFHAAARAIKLLREQTQQRFIGGGIDGRCGDFDAQLIGERPGNFIGGSARLQLHREQKPVRLLAQEWRNCRVCGHGWRFCGGLASIPIQLLTPTEYGRITAIMRTRPRSSSRNIGIGLLIGLSFLAGCASDGDWRTAARKLEAEPTVARVAQPLPRSALAEAAAKPSAPLAGTGWRPLFDGKTLYGWQVTDFVAHGIVTCDSGLIVIDSGATLTGINWTNTNDLPRMDYELALDAMRLDGSDFFCALTFPVADSHCTLVLGGWGGSITGLSSIDDQDASENETSRWVMYDTKRWYRARVRVTEGKIEAWLDDEQIVNIPTAGRKIGLRFGDIELSKPLGVATYETRAAIREIKLRRLD
jgi:hypothetical protein